MENYQELKTLTETLHQYTNQALHQFDLIKNSEESIDIDFYHDVKPFADLVKNTAEEWKLLVLVWIENEYPKHVHSIQIVSACENLNLISVQAFFKETKEKRFKEMYHAVQYLLENILEKLEQKG
jgi:hypothetical protein